MTDKVLNALWKVAVGSSGPKYPYLSGTESTPENLPKTVAGSGLVRPSLSYLPRSHKTDPALEAAQRAGADEAERQRILEKAPKTFADFGKGLLRAGKSAVSAIKSFTDGLPLAGYESWRPYKNPMPQPAPRPVYYPGISKSESAPNATAEDSWGRGEDRQMPRPVPDQGDNDSQRPRRYPNQNVNDKFEEQQSVAKAASGLGLGLHASSPLQSIAKAASARALNKLAKYPLYTGPGATGPGYDANADATRANNSPSIKPQPKKTVDKKRDANTKTPKAQKHPSKATATSPITGETLILEGPNYKPDPFEPGHAQSFDK